MWQPKAISQTPKSTDKSAANPLSTNNQPTEEEKNAAATTIQQAFRAHRTYKGMVDPISVVNIFAKAVSGDVAQKLIETLKASPKIPKQKLDQILFDFIQQGFTAGHQQYCMLSPDFIKESVEKIISKLINVDIIKLDNNYYSLNKKQQFTTQSDTNNQSSKNPPQSNLNTSVNDQIHSIILKQLTSPDKIDIIGHSQRNLLRLLNTLRNCTGLPSNERQQIQRLRKNDALFTPKEEVIVTTLKSLLGMSDDTNHGAIKLYHYSAHGKQILDSGLFVSARLAKELNPEQQLHTFDQTKLRELIFFLLTGDETIPYFLRRSGCFDKMVVDSSILLQSSVAGNYSFFGTFDDWIKYSQSTKNPPEFFGISNDPNDVYCMRAVTFTALSADCHFDQNSIKKTVYVRSNGVQLERKVRKSQDIFHGSHILLAAIYEFIIELRYIGGRYQEYLHNNPDNKAIMLAAFNKLIKMEIKAVHQFKHENYLNKHLSQLDEQDQKLSRQVLLAILFYAIETDHFELFRELVAKIDINTVDTVTCRNLLIHAVLKNKTNIAKFIIALGIDLNYMDIFGCTALMYATFLKNRELIIELSAPRLFDDQLYYADIAHVNDEETNRVINASDIAIKSQNLKAIIQANIEFIKEFTDKHHCNTDEVVKNIIARIDNIPQENRDVCGSYTLHALNIAIYQRDPESVALLCKRGVTVERKAFDIAVCHAENVIPILLAAEPRLLGYCVQICLDLHKSQALCQLMRTSQHLIPEQLREYVVKQLLEEENPEKTLSLLHEIYKNKIPENINTIIGLYLKDVSVKSLLTLEKIGFIQSTPGDPNTEKLFLNALKNTNSDAILYLRNKVTNKCIAHGIIQILSHYLEYEDNAHLDDWYDRSWFIPLLKRLSTAELNEIYYWKDSYGKQYPCTILMGLVATRDILLCELAIAQGAKANINTGENALSIACLKKRPSINLLLLLFNNGATLDTKIKVKITGSYPSKPQSELALQLANANPSNPFSILQKQTQQIANASPTSSPENSDDEDYPKAMSAANNTQISIYKKLVLRRHDTYFRVAYAAYLHTVNTEDYDHIRYILCLENRKIIFENGESLWHIAVKTRNTKLLELLKLYRSDPNIFNTNGETPLMIAAAQSDKETVTILMSAGALVDITLTAFTAIHYAKDAEIKTQLQQSTSIHPQQSLEIYCSHFEQSVARGNITQINTIICKCADTSLRDDIAKFIVENFSKIIQNKSIKLWENLVLPIANLGDRACILFILSSIEENTIERYHLLHHVEPIFIWAVNNLELDIIKKVLPLLKPNQIIADKPAIYYVAEKLVSEFIKVSSNSEAISIEQKQIPFSLLKIIAEMSRTHCLEWPSSEGCHAYQYIEKHLVAIENQTKNKLMSFLNELFKAQKIRFITQYRTELQNSTYLPVINELASIIVEKESSATSKMVSFANNQLTFNLKDLHPAQKLIIPYLFGFSNLTGRDALHVELVGNDYVITLDGKEHILSEIGNKLYLTEHHRKISLPTHRLHVGLLNLSQVTAILLSLELSTLLVSHQNYLYYTQHNEKSPAVSKYYPKMNLLHQRCIGLGATDSVNLLVPDRLQDVVIKAYLNPVNHQSVIIDIIEAKDIQLIDIKNILCNILKIPSESCIIQDAKLEINIPIMDLLKIIKQKRVNYLGIVHLDQQGNIAIAERIKSGETIGYCTPGGHCSDPYHVRMSATHESKEEIGLEIAEITQLEMLRHSEGTATLLARNGNYTGTIEADTQEFRVQSERFISFKSIRESKILLRADTSSIIDYLKHEEKNINQEIAKLLPGIVINVNIGRNVHEGTLKEKKFHLAKSNFGVITITSPKLDAVKQLLATLLPDINIIETSNCIIIDDVNPAVILHAISKEVQLRLDLKRNVEIIPIEKAENEQHSVFMMR